MKTEKKEEKNQLQEKSVKTIKKSSYSKKKKINEIYIKIILKYKNNFIEKKCQI